MPRYNSQRPRATRGQVTWQPGDIAFLKHFDRYSRKDYTNLISSGHLAKEATVHPVILLSVYKDSAIIMPASAFHTEEREFQAPWEQKWHRAKKRDHFRAFEGTRRPNNKYAALRLADASMRMPKPQASWVYTQNFYCVPFSVLGWFDKSSRLLRVHPESLEQLNFDIKHDYPHRYDDACTRLAGAGAAEPATTPRASHVQAPKAPTLVATTCAHVAQRPAIVRPQLHKVPAPEPAKLDAAAGVWATRGFRSRPTHVAPTFAQMARRPGANRPQHLLARTPGIRVAS